MLAEVISQSSLQNNEKQKYNFDNKFLLQPETQSLTNLIQNITLEETQSFQQKISNYFDREPKVYFCKGFLNQELSINNQRKIQNFVNQDPYGSSFQVYEPKQLQRRLKLWNEKLPWIQIKYAVKANPCELLLKDLIENQISFDAASIGEILILSNLGADMSKIVYSNPVKDIKGLLFAYEKGIRLTTADGIQELLKIKKIAPDMKILWRFQLKEESINGISSVFSNKFGDDDIFPLEKAENRFNEIFNLGINLEGLDFHCGSGFKGATTFKKFIETSKQLIQIGRKCGHNMKILDIGGGFPGGDINQDILDALYLTTDDPLNYTVIAEPGRHFSQEMFYFLLRVIGEKQKKQTRAISVNDSVYHALNNFYLDHMSQHFEAEPNQLYDQQLYPVQELQPTTIFGMTCCGQDIIAHNISLPKELQEGDWICIGGMGTYTNCMRSIFNYMDSVSRVEVLNE